MMNKQAITLTINFTITLILAILMFGIGLKLAFDIFDLSNETLEKIRERIREDLEKELADQGLAISAEKIKNGDHAEFIFGIRNENQANSFYVVMDCDLVTTDLVLCDDDAGISCDQYDSMILENPIGPIVMKANEKEYASILVSVNDQPKGIYVFDINVCRDSDCISPYLAPKKLTIIVD